MRLRSGFFINLANVHMAHVLVKTCAGPEIEWAWSFRMLLYDNLNQLNALNRSLM